MFKGYYWAKCTFYPNFKTAIMAIKSLNSEIWDLEEIQVKLQCLYSQPSLSIIKYLLTYILMLVSSTAISFYLNFE